MSPQELATLRMLISEAVTATVNKAIPLAVQPLQEQIEELKGVDKRFDTDLRKHSGAHRDLSTNVRQSLDAVKVEVKTATLESVNAKLDDFRVEMLEANRKLSTAPAAAEGAKTAAIQASTAAAAVSFDTAQIRSKQDAQAHREAIRFYVNMVAIPILVAVATAIVHALQ